MRITARQLRQIIREELFLEGPYAPRIKTVGGVQGLLNHYLKGVPEFVPLKIDNQWAELTNAAWEMFIDNYYDMNKAIVRQVDVAPTAGEIKASWVQTAPRLGFKPNAEGAAKFIEFFADTEYIIGLPPDVKPESATHWDCLFPRGNDIYDYLAEDLNVKNPQGTFIFTPAALRAHEQEVRAALSSSPEGWINLFAWSPKPARPRMYTVTATAELDRFFGTSSVGPNAAMKEVIQRWVRLARLQG